MDKLIQMLSGRCPCEMAWTEPSHLIRAKVSKVKTETGEDGRQKLVILTSEVRQLVGRRWEPLHEMIQDEFSEMRFDLEYVNRNVRIEQEGIISFTLPFIGETRIYPQGHRSNILD